MNPFTFQAVYQLAWSADSRLIVSGSADSTLKLWSVKNKKMEADLPGKAASLTSLLPNLISITFSNSTSIFSLYLQGPK